MLHFRVRRAKIKWVMQMDNEMPKRKPIRLKEYDYSQPGAYFLTICTESRKKCFWKTVGARIARPQDVPLNAYGRIVDDAINKIHTIYPAVYVAQYVIMPNHIHLLLEIHPDACGRPMVAPTMDRIVRQFKGYVTKQIGTSVWQKLYFDHIIRNRQDYDEHMRYIYENPLCWMYDELYCEDEL